MCATVKALPTKCVRFPSDEGLVEVVSGFENIYGFPQYIGAVDVTHIPILGPEDCAKDYFNLKVFHFIIMQAVADHRYCFMYIYVGVLFMMQQSSETQSFI